MMTEEQKKYYQEVFRESWSLMKKYMGTASDNDQAWEQIVFEADGISRKGFFAQRLIALILWEIETNC